MQLIPSAQRSSGGKHFTKINFLMKNDIILEYLLDFKIICGNFREVSLFHKKELNISYQNEWYIIVQNNR